MAAKHPETVARLRAGYEEWFRDVSSDRHYAPARIYLGVAQENPVVLTRQDWRVPPEPKSPLPPWWEVDVRRAGNYEVTLTLDPADTGQIRFEIGKIVRQAAVEKGAAECRLGLLPLPEGPAQLKAFEQTRTRARGARFVEIRRT